MSETPHFKLALDEVCFFIDADGTLLDISQRPEYTQAPRGLLTVLDQLYYALDGALAIVSGRRIEDLDRIFAPLRLPASGIHGVQIRSSSTGAIADGDVPEIAAPVRELVGRIARRHPGVFIEDKGKALAVHWRAAPQAEAPLRAELDAAIAAFSPALALLAGHCVYEVKSAATDKGKAVRALMEISPFVGRRPIFIGDDVTDIAGMAAARALGGHAFSVGQQLEGAEGVFAAPSDVRAWLGALVGARQEARRA